MLNCCEMEGSGRKVVQQNGWVISACDLRTAKDQISVSTPLARPFGVQFGVVNTRQFEKNKDRRLICKSCGIKPAFVECFARRYVSTTSNHVKIYHYGNHTCPVITPKNKNTVEISQILKRNPSIKPSEIQSSCILSAFRERSDWQKVEKEVEATLDRKWLANLKSKLKNDLEPVGHDFESVVTFKEYCDKKD